MRIAVRIIMFYRKHISPLFPPMCRYYPSCSMYAAEAIERYGLFRGGFLAAKRLMRCNILFPGGFDPVPELTERERKRKSGK